MKVVQTPARYAPHIGGVEAVAQQICERLLRDGDEPLVICADEPRGAPGEINGVPVLRLPWPGKVANTNLTPGLPAALARADFDVIHTHLPTPWSADVSALVGSARGKRVVVQFHNEIVGDGGNARIAAAYQRTVQRLTLHLADVVLCLSWPWHDRLVARYPGVRDKIQVIPNGVDVDRFKPPLEGRGNDVLFVSVLDDFHAYKGLEVLLRALVGAPELRLRVVGEGPRRGWYADLARTLGVADRVVFLGAVSDPELEALYRTCGIFTLPSQYAAHEGGSSLVVMEAMASGLPVVVAEGSGDIAWLVEREGAGLRTAAGDIDALRDALRDLAADPAERRRMGAAGRSYVVAHHSWDVIVDRIRAHYRREGSQQRQPTRG